MSFFKVGLAIVNKDKSQITEIEEGAIMYGQVSRKDKEGKGLFVRELTLVSLVVHVMRHRFESRGREVNMVIALLRTYLTARGMLRR